MQCALVIFSITLKMNAAFLATIMLDKYGNYIFVWLIDARTASPQIVGMSCSRPCSIKLPFIHGEEFLYFFTQSIFFKRCERIHAVARPAGVPDGTRAFSLP